MFCISLVDSQNISVPWFLDYFNFTWTQTHHNLKYFPFSTVLFPPQRFSWFLKQYENRNYSRRSLEKTYLHYQILIVNDFWTFITVFFFSRSMASQSDSIVFQINFRKPIWVMISDYSPRHRSTIKREYIYWYL